MKVVHIVSSDRGGAARAAIRISNSINYINEGISIVLVGKKDGTNYLVDTILKDKLHKACFIINNLLNDITLKRYSLSSFYSNSVFGFDISSNKQIEECDVIHLHWINGGMLSYKYIERLKKLNKPIVWTLHDMWAFTGGCHYDENCGKYKKTCFKCNVIHSNENKDLSSKIQERKKKIYNNMNLTIVGCSEWITKCAKESSLLKDKICINIPNAIDVDIFKPISKKVAKGILNIKTDKKIILFGAMSSTSDERKGYRYLLESIKKLDSNKYVAVIFGNIEKNIEIEEYLETIYFGQLFDNYSLSLLYSSADVFVAPSKQENLANTVMESLSCGTPVVAFNIGGMKDMIKHEWNGYLAEPFKVEDLARGIVKCIENSERFGENARNFVCNNFSYEVIGKRYTELYKSLLKDV